MSAVDELARKYHSQIGQLQGLFPSWDEGDLAFTLQDAKGNVEEAALMITEGRASQFTQATSRKKSSKPATKDVPSSKAHTNRNADSGGWEAVNGDVEGRAGRGGRGGRGARGGRGGRGGEPFRGARGGRGGARGRGGFTNANGKSKDLPTTTATTTEGWANQVAQATSEGADENGWSEAPLVDSKIDGGWGEGEDDLAPAAASKADDFSAAGGLGDAPARNELEKAAARGGSSWQETIKRPVQVAPPTVPPAPAPAVKKTWAQIAKPAEKPKPVPPPAPAPIPAEPVKQDVTSDEPVAQDDVEVPVEIVEETVTLEVEGWRDAPAQSEFDAAAAVTIETISIEVKTNGHAEELLPEETLLAEEEFDDPAIASVGAKPSWAQSKPQAVESAAPLAPEPVTTYTVPPGFNALAAKTQAQLAIQPRTNSRSAMRHKTADDQGVVLPPSLGGLSSMEMQFGSLSFGGMNGDGIDAPVPEPVLPSTLAAQSPPRTTALPPVSSPIRAPQPPPAQPVQPAAVLPAQQAPVTQPSSLPTSTYLHQTAQPAQPVVPQPSAQHQGYLAPHQTLQQQMHAYQSQNQYHQQQQPAQPQTSPSAQSLEPPASIQPQQQHNLYGRQQEHYGSVGQSPHQAAQTPESQHATQPQHAQTGQPATPQAAGAGQGQYDSFGSGFSQSHLYGQQNQPAEYGQRTYDSYSGAGYPRPPMEEKQTPAQSHTPTGGHPQHGQQVPQGAPYYGQMGNMYYQQAPYNPYMPYGQAPQPGFQQYYPMSQRNLYGQPSAPLPPAQPKPAAPTQSYPFSGVGNTYDEQSFASLNRYDKPHVSQTHLGSHGQHNVPHHVPAQAQGQTLSSSYPNTGGLHSFLGTHTTTPTAGANTTNSNSNASNTNAGRQTATPDEGLKGQTQQGQGQTQGQARPGAYGYGAYGNQEWGQYGGHYAGNRNGYSGWPQ
ncbi:hypothetical protein M231_03086 [Tremella mesenterica]|uniref:RNA polymerase II degradation factor 1 n=1 Tax=Tremella mesenterica TaxID=5217 RepID=A0A4Q1BNX4_TREME|nr:hypothetical protein M231_03086 [Tremella mesenterica]